MLGFKILIREIYIPDTTNFPDSGKLLIGKEIISYTEKPPQDVPNPQTDRLLGVSRGVDGTTEDNHFAGSMLRTIGISTTA